MEVEWTLGALLNQLLADSHGAPSTSYAPSKYLAVSERYTIACDVRGAVATPECSATAYFDRLLLGQEHLGVWMSKRLPECSTCSP